MMRSGDVKSAKRTVHTVKSLAGNIGATGLSMAAANLEGAIATLEEGSMEALLKTFSLQLDIVINGLKGYFQEEQISEPHIMISRIDHDAVNELLNSISELLESDVGQALRMLKKLQEHLEHSFLAKEFSQLEQEMVVFDSAAAGKSLEVIRILLEQHGDKQL
jgi:two-component system sensor histidine kinase/response regulator